MAPQDRRSSNRGKKDSHGGGQGGPSREVTVSKALSWLLRHGAAKERIAMDGQGYVRVDALLRWNKLKALGVGIEELVGVVEGNEKKRFALRWVGGGGKEVDGEVTATSTTKTTNTDVSPIQAAESTDQQTETETETETETQRAIQRASTDLDPSHYLIRATQGHSLKTLEASAYLAPITLENPRSIPETVVHGTFYGAWERILATGGLKPMTRVHVHFATGPKLDEVLTRGEGEQVDGPEAAKKTNLVISGMRSDAQILIYIDVKRALEAGVEFWTSENGVVLTEGMVAATADDGAGEGGMMLSSEFWDVVVEIKAGLGVLWRQGEGVVRALPPELKGRGIPRGKERVERAERGGRGGKGSGDKGDRGGGGRGNAKPKLRVERDDREMG